MKEQKQPTQLLKKYNRYLLLERGLSKNTIEAYLTDLQKLQNYLIIEKIDLLDVTLSTLQQFSAGLHTIGIQPSSQARIISGIKSFYNFLILDDYLEIDPTELLESPQIGFKLPEVLSVIEIDNLIQTIDLSKKEGQRNRAILETLYSCGLRVSELTNLQISDLHFKENLIKVTGKGSKQRLVPISPKAQQEIELYFIDRHAQVIKKGFEDFLFISLRGVNISRIMVFHIIKELAKTAGITKKISPHTFRHSFATHLLEGGANLIAIQKMLGHESVESTEIYTHLDREFLRTEIITHHPRNIETPKKETEEEPKYV